jgi:hypothetical protein
MWREPQADWLPIARAVFRFTITGSDRRSTETFLDDSKLLSIEDIEKLIEEDLRRDNADAIANETNPDPLSLYNLRKTLRDKAGADHAEINLENASFTISFKGPPGACWSCAPWHLNLSRDPVEIDPKLEWEARFNKGNGFVIVDDETATLSAQQLEAVHSASDHVWNQLMLPAFAQWVRDGRIRIYAQVESHRAQFQELPAHLCSKLTIENWHDGTAYDPNGDRYYSIHAADGLTKVSPRQAEVSPEMPSSKRRTNNARGRPEEYSWEEIKDFALGLVEKYGVPAPTNKKLPRREDLVKEIQDEWAKRDIHLAPSTVRRHLSTWLSGGDQNSHNC